MTSDKSSYTFGIWGFGHIAPRHVEAIGSSDVGKVVAGYDNAAAGRQKMEGHGIDCIYGDVDAFLANPFRIAVICTPSGLHASHTLAALKAGKDVVVEKPLALSIEDAMTMMVTAKDVGRRLFLVKQNRFNPAVLAVRQLMQSGGLGKILSVSVNGFWNRPSAYYQSSWKGTKALDGGILYNQFSHFIDLLIWFFGPLEAVAGIAANRHKGGNIEFEDVFTGLARTTDGAPVDMHFTVNAARHNMEGAITIFGAEATVKIGGNYLDELKYAAFESKEMADMFELEHERIKRNSSELQGHRAVYLNVRDTLEGRSREHVSPEDGLRCISLIASMYAVCNAPRH
jgi:predicted dehydrogenase